MKSKKSREEGNGIDTGLEISAKSVRTEGLHGNSEREETHFISGNEKKRRKYLKILNK